MYLTLREWWYRRGVAGFRLDAVNTLFEDPALKDNPMLPGTNAFGDPNTRELSTTTRSTGGAPCAADRSAQRWRMKTMRCWWEKPGPSDMDAAGAVLRAARRRTADADGLDVHDAEQAFCAGVSCADRGGEFFGRLAGVCARATTTSCGRGMRYGDGVHNDADREVHGGAVSDIARHADYVLRGRNRDDE